MSYNVSLVCDAAPSLTKARGRCGDEARRSAEEPEAPSEAPMHIRAVMGRCVFYNSWIITHLAVLEENSLLQIRSITPSSVPTPYYIWWSPPTYLLPHPGERKMYFQDQLQRDVFTHPVQKILNLPDHPFEGNAVVSERRAKKLNGGRTSRSIMGLLFRGHVVPKHKNPWVEIWAHG
jgi:hypothetical protein